MKKFLLLIVTAVTILTYSNAQVVEITGQGVLNDDFVTLSFNDLSTIDHVVVEAMAFFDTRTEFPPVDNPPVNVEFSDFDETESAVFMPVELNYGPHTQGFNFYFGYYTATFNTVDAAGITLDKNGQGNAILSYYAYVYRTDGNIDMYSMTDEDHAFIFHNGSGDPVVYEFDLPFSANPRDIEVVMPFSDNESLAERYAHVTLISGTEETSDLILLNGVGDNLRLETLNLANVPGDVTKVMVEIYSPVLGVDDVNGDSFFVGMVLLNVHELVQGCTLTQGYWKTHSSYGPAKKTDATWDMVGGPDATFFLSGQTYLDVLNTPVQGNKYYILAHQYIAAELNMLAGANGGAVDTEFEHATTLLETYTPEQIAAMKGKNGKEITEMFTYLGGILGDYNEGLIGPGHCGDEEEEVVVEEKSAEIISVQDFEVYPNPVREYATVSFVPVQEGTASVELINFLGQKSDVLYHQNVQKDVPVSFRFDTQEYNEGLYIIRVDNGSSKENFKINIIK